MGLPSFLDLPKSVFASNSYIHFMRMKLDDWRRIGASGVTYLRL
jgi:hypothetical protein